MTGFRKVDADLMRPSGFEAALNQRESVEPFERAQMRDGPFALTCDGRTASFAVSAIFDQKRFDRLRTDVAISDCQIRPFDRMNFELPDQALAGFWTSREENKPARVTVDAVDGIDLRRRDSLFRRSPSSRVAMS